MSIYFIGDGILDNHLSLQNKELDLRKEIINLGYNVHNFAIDEIKLIEIIDGVIPNKLYTVGRNYPYQINKDGKLYPLQELTKKISPNKSFTPIYNGISSLEIKKNNDNMTVISIGGSDINTKFFNITLGTDYFVNATLTEEFINNYQKIIETIQIDCKKIVLVSMYLPYLGTGSSYAKYSSFATPIMDKWHEFLYSLAKKYDIPVLDLNKTLNNKDRTHYGVNDTRTSNISSKCIAKCLTYIYSHYDNHHIYYAPNCNISKIVTES